MPPISLPLPIAVMLPNDGEAGCGVVGVGESEKGGKEDGGGDTEELHSTGDEVG